MRPHCERRGIWLLVDEAADQSWGHLLWHDRYRREILVQLELVRNPLLLIFKDLENSHGPMLRCGGITVSAGWMKITERNLFSSAQTGSKRGSPRYRWPKIRTCKQIYMTNFLGQRFTHCSRHSISIWWSRKCRSFFDEVDRFFDMRKGQHGKISYLLYVSMVE